MKICPRLLILLSSVIATLSAPLSADETPDASTEFDHPVVQMLIPGFRVRELPVELTNINNLRYRHDGTLVALAYNGDIHLLKDTDNDGLEDSSQLFHENDGSILGPLGMVLTPPGSEHGNGAFIVCKGKVVLVTDRGGDDEADEVSTIADGWPVIPHGVDSLGLAMDSDGDLYFGIGVTNFANPYMIGDDGKPGYDIGSVRGTIQRISADLKTRETVCTGIRFPVGLAFNHEGELFCTDQEGATWLANGNPLDELLHIQKDRHYGFPPRHPRHLPDVVDEPSVFNYGPQHQSTCGLFFNESVNNGPSFGPEFWKHDAIVCGESRGQLWRTKLVRTDSGYVAATQTLARLQMLTVDACVTPDGSLAVCCHSGPPDWGTGPTGKGRLFRIEPVREAVARPVIAWSAGPDEFRIAFDRAVQPQQFDDLIDAVQVEYGRFVRSGQQFETLKPPYELLFRQQDAPRPKASVHSVTLEDDARTLVLKTDPVPVDLHPHTHCAITIPLPEEQSASAKSGQIEQLAVLAVDAAFTGVVAEWRADVNDSSPKWSGWLPHWDLKVCRQLLAGSAHHDSLWRLLETPGALRLTTRLNVRNVLRPDVQPGAQIDFEYPEEVVTTHIHSDRPLMLAVKSGSTSLAIARNKAGHSAGFAVKSSEPAAVDVSMLVGTGNGGVPLLSVSFTTNEDDRPRPVALERFRLPWTKEHTADDSLFRAARRIPEIAGGEWERGRKLFHGDKANCSKCHTRTGSSEGIGPDLKNLVHRDAYSVSRDIMTPSLTINPDYVSQVIVTKAGLALTGVLRTEGDQLFLGDSQGKRIPIDRDEIESMQPSTVSVMPQDIAKGLSPDDMKDLLMYLLRPAPAMPLDSPLDAPPVRTPAEVDRVLKGSEPQNPSPKPLNIVLVAGEKDHGPGEHDYPAWLQMWQELLAFDSSLTVSTAMDFPSDHQLTSADVAIFFQMGHWDDERQAAIDEFQKRGAGLLYIHWAVKGWDRAEDFAKRIGLSGAPKLKFRHGPLTLNLHNTDHPILRNFETLQLYDESYWNLVGDLSDATVLATSDEDGTAQPQFWVKENGAGRVVVSIPGHYNWTFDDPLFRLLLLRSTAWAAREPIDRFNALVYPGARMKLE